MPIDFAGNLYVRTEYCNIYGAQWDGGAARVLGGLIEAPPERQWNCEHKAIGRYRMECEHGHRGQVMPLCTVHVRQYATGKVQFCPRCNQGCPSLSSENKCLHTPSHDHRCVLSLTEVS